MASTTEVTDFCFISKIPIFLLHEIFFRLPIKGIVRCKCVCPSWNSLLSKPEFSQNYAKYSPFTTFLHCVNPDPDDVCSVHLLQVSQNGDDYYYETSEIIPKVHNSTSHYLSYVGACNGFLCMELRVFDQVEGDCIYVTNPIMGDSIQLPKLPLPLEDNRFVEYAFGFSPVTNNYKVLRIVFKTFIVSTVEKCEIFTVGVDRSWRRLRNSFEFLPITFGCVALNGFFHWIPRCCLEAIVTFDLAKEKFGQISLPPGFSLVYNSMDLAVFGNQLRLVDFSVQSQISIWTIKKTSTVESWTQLTLRTDWLPCTVRGRNLVPVAELRNGDMLFLYSGEYLVYCNVEQRRCSQILLKEGVGNYESYFMPGYSPSFSLHAEHIAKSKHCVLFRADAIIKKRCRITPSDQQD